MKRIEMLPLKELVNFKEPKVCICAEDLCFESYQPSRADLKKARQISTNINEICIAIVHIGSRNFAMTESCHFLHRPILFNAEKIQEEQPEGVIVYVESTLSREFFFKEKIKFTPGKVL